MPQACGGCVSAPTVALLGSQPGRRRGAGACVWLQPMRPSLTAGRGLFVGLCFRVLSHSYFILTGTVASDNYLNSWGPIFLRRVGRLYFVLPNYTHR